MGSTKRTPPPLNGSADDAQLRNSVPLAFSASPNPNHSYSGSSSGGETVPPKSHTLSPRNLAILTALFLIAVAALLIMKMNAEAHSRRVETELRLIRTVQAGVASMNLEIMTGITPGQKLGQDLPKDANVTFYHLSVDGQILASTESQTEDPVQRVRIDPLSLSTLTLDRASNRIIDQSPKPLAASWHPLDNGQVLLAITPMRDMFGRSPLWIGYVSLLGAITLLSALLMRALIRQNHAAIDAETTLLGYLDLQEALARARSSAWYYDEMSRKVSFSHTLLGPLGLGARDRSFSLHELTSLIHPQDLRATLSIFTGEGRHQGDIIARLRHSAGGWSRVLFRTASNITRRQRSGMAIDLTGSEISNGVASLSHTSTEQAHAPQAHSQTQSQAEIQTPNSTSPTDLISALDIFPDAFIVWGADQKLVGWNHRFTTLFKIPRNKLRSGLSWPQVYEAARIRQDLMAGHFGPDSEHKNQSIEVGVTEDRWLHIYRRWTQQGILICIASNVTEQKKRARAYLKRERELERTVTDLEQSRRELSETSRNYAYEKRRAEEASRSKSEFLANMSHELRTPLNAINGFSEVMQSELYGPLGNTKYKEYVDDIHASGRHLLELIDDILDMSRIEAGRMELLCERISLEKVIAESIRLAGSRNRKTAQRLMGNTQSTPPVFADQRAAKQVILNLLSNAMKFTPEGGQITLTTDADLDSVSILITDTGPGIEPDRLRTLGSPFEMGEQSFSGPRQGSGLGLALSKSLMELQGGLLALVSRPGRGTIACATFPRREEAAVRLPLIIREDAHILTNPMAEKHRNKTNPSSTKKNNKPQAPQAAE